MTVKMIDFPTVVAAPDQGGIDKNYLDGLALLMSDLARFIAEKDVK